MKIRDEKQQISRLEKYYNCIFEVILINNDLDLKFYFNGLHDELINWTGINIADTDTKKYKSKKNKYTNNFTFKPNQFQINRSKPNNNNLLKSLDNTFFNNLNKIFVNTDSNIVGIEINGENSKPIPEFIRNFTDLKLLKVIKSSIDVFPSWIIDLKQLEYIDFSFNEIDNIPLFINNLTKIKTIDLKNNSIADINSQILKSIKANIIDLSYNKITKLHKDTFNANYVIDIDSAVFSKNNFLYNDYLVKTVKITGNPIVSPPLEIIRRGRVSIDAYYSSIAQKTLPLNEVKAIIIGDGGAGKTSLVKRLTRDEFNQNESQTHGINIDKWMINNCDKKTTVNIWDFGGQEIMHTTHQFFLSERSLYILVLDGRKEEDADYWLKHIESFGGGSPLLVVINKNDENPGYDLNRRFLKNKYQNIQGFHKVSCKTSDGMEDLKKDIINAAENVEIVKTEWPEQWFEIKKLLIETNKHLLTYEECKKICVAQGVVDRKQQDTLISFLHDLGVVLHFQDFRLKDKHILDPRWLTNAVYQIINSKLLAFNHGILSLEELSNILCAASFDKYTYELETHAFIIDIMKKFELCYLVNENSILVPDLLEVQEPDFEFDYDNCLSFRVDYDEFLPRSILPRLVVKQHASIYMNLRWRSGIVLCDKTLNTISVIKSDQSSKKIYVYVNGEHKRDHLTIIRASILEINKSFEKLKWYEKIPLPDNQNITVGYDHLLRLESMNEENYYPEGASRYYNVQNLLGTVRIDRKIGEKDFIELLKKLISEDDVEKDIAEKANDILILQPNFMGLGINLNNIVKLISKKNKSSSK